MKENELSPCSFMDFALDEEAARLDFLGPAEPAAKEPEKPAAPKQDETEFPSPAALSEPEPERATPTSSKVVDDPRFPSTSIVKVWKLQSAVSIAGNFQPEPFDIRRTPSPQADRKAKKPENNEEKEGLSERAMIAAIFFTLVGLTGVYAFLRNQPPPAKPTAFPMQLSVEARGDGLNIFWNPQSAAIVQARKGRLLILEESQKTETIPLDEKQLASGHLYYRSSGDRIQLQLEIMDLTGNLSKESVFAFSSKARR